MDNVIRQQTRRQILKTAIGGAAGILLSSPALRLAAAGVQTPTAPEIVRLSEDLFIVKVPGEANVVAQVASEGVVLVDGGSAAGSAALLKAVSALPGAGPVRTLFNTHWHPEQTGSNETLAKAGATIVAHENTRLWLQQNVTWPWNGKTVKKLPKSAQPTKTFYENGKLDSGVTYGYISDAAHTDGDLYVLFPKQNVLVVGDAAYGQGWPVVDWWSGGWIGGIVGGLQRIQALMIDDQTKIVPATGPVMGIAELRPQIDLYGTIYGRLSQMMNNGQGPSEAVASKVFREYEAKMGNADEFTRRAFESLWAYLSPDA